MELEKVEMSVREEKKSVYFHAVRKQIFVSSYWGFCAINKNCFQGFFGETSR